MSSSAQSVSELRNMLEPLRSALGPLMIISAAFNVLMLSGSFFMLLVYDEVLASRSEATLVGLILMVVVAYGFQALLDLVRSRATLHAGAMLDHRLSDRIYDVLSGYELRFGRMEDGLSPVRDLDNVRNYLSGPGPLALLDLPYVLLFLIILFLFHVYLGLLATLGVIVLVTLMLVTSRVSKEPTRHVAKLGSARYTLAETNRRNAEVIRALGMGERNRRAWRNLSRSLLGANDKMAGVVGKMQAGSKAFRQLLQSLMLATGAFLVIVGEATGGVIIAASILSARALLPVEQVIANWKSMTLARQSWQRLDGVLVAMPEEAPPMALPAPAASLSVENLIAAPPGTKRATIANVSFLLQAGETLGVVGRSGSGKSTLMRNIVGAWPIARGHIRLDGADLRQWEPNILGKHIGYVPQSIEMFEGTIAQNISRFDEDAQPDAIIAAARAADIHDFILQLDGGYSYQLSPGAGPLSAGQMQRVALARALYGDPFLIVLDEPNSNLDHDGEMALIKAIGAARARNAIVIVVAHRTALLTRLDYVMVMAKGEVAGYGKRDEMMQRINLLSNSAKQVEKN